MSMPSRAAALGFAVLLAWPSGFGRVCCCSDETEHMGTAETSPTTDAREGHHHGVHGHGTHTPDHHRRRKGKHGGVELRASTGASECPPWISPEKGISLAPERNHRDSGLAPAEAAVIAASGDLVHMPVRCEYDAHAPPAAAAVPLHLQFTILLV